MTEFDGKKSHFPTFAKARDFYTSPELRQLSRRLYFVALPFVVAIALIILISALSNHIANQ